MEQLLDAVAAVASLISPEKVDAIAIRIRQIDIHDSAKALGGVVGTPLASRVVEQLLEAWHSHPVPPGELASMLLAASHVLRKASANQSIELVWTGPTTPVVSARRTEQSLLQVINAAKESLIIMSFVAYDVSGIVKALNEASDRRVQIAMLLESSQEHGGSIINDAIGKMRVLVPSARLYAWIDKDEPFSDGRVHAKVAVADSEICFITSANLTGYAMEKNMEAGVLIKGGHIPRLLEDHLRSLIDTKVVSQV